MALSFVRHRSVFIQTLIAGSIAALFVAGVARAAEGPANRTSCDAPEDQARAPSVSGRMRRRESVRPEREHGLAPVPAGTTIRVRSSGGRFYIDFRAAEHASSQGVLSAVRQYKQ
jgi:hypothetical protein